MPAATEARRFRTRARARALSALLISSLGSQDSARKPSAKGSSALGRHRGSKRKTKETAAAGKRTRQDERSEEERRGEERTVGFSAGTSQFSQPFMLPTDFFALFSRLIHTSPHEIRSSIPTCIISQDTDESSFPALALCRSFHTPVCMRRALLDLSHSSLPSPALLTTFKYLSVFLSFFFRPLSPPVIDCLNIFLCAHAHYRVVSLFFALSLYFRACFIPLGTKLDR